MTTATATRTAHLSSQGRGVAHTMRCATVANYQRLRNGVGRGNCPDLTECTFDEAVQLIETRCMFECKLCKRMREAEAKRFHTADGTEADPGSTPGGRLTSASRPRPATDQEAVPMNDTSELAARAAAAFDHEETRRTAAAQETAAADFQRIWDAFEAIGVPVDKKVAVRNSDDGALCVPIFPAQDTRHYDDESGDWEGEYRPGVVATLRDGDVWIFAEDDEGLSENEGRYLPVGPLDGLATIGRALARGGRHEYKPRTAAGRAEHLLHSIPGDNVTRKDSVQLAATEALCIAILDLAEAIRTART